MKKIKGFLVHVDRNIVQEVTVIDELDFYYDLLDCDMIDIVTRSIGERECTIICDDEGLLKSFPKNSAVNGVGDVMFVGNLLIVNSDKNGVLTGLSKNDVEYLRQYVRTIITGKYPEPYSILQVDYL